jgi:hypothetical protein
MFEKLKKWYNVFQVKDEVKKYTKNEQSAKEIATANKQPYIEVLNTHVNPENVRFGFFELDWNDYFIEQLKTSGYQGNTPEEIVDLWFQDLCRNIGSEEGVDMNRRPSGYINVNRTNDGKTEIS